LVDAGLNLTLEAGSGGALTASMQQYMQNLITVGHHIHHFALKRVLLFPSYEMLVESIRLCLVVLMAIAFVQSR